MQLNVTEKDNELAWDFFSRYKNKPGSEFIASEFAIAHLSALLQEIKPARVIEYGAGIGTMTHLLLAHPVGVKEVVTTETNEFCLEQLKLNIPVEYKSRLKIVTQQNEIGAIGQKCDLVIFDGGAISPEKIGFLGKNSVCFLEGDRSSTALAINEGLGKIGLKCVFKNYHQGYEYFSFRWRQNAATGRKWPKFKLRKLKKGFRLGKVVSIQN